VELLKTVLRTSKRKTETEMKCRMGLKRKPPSAKAETEENPVDLDVAEALLREKTSQKLKPAKMSRVAQKKMKSLMAVASESAEIVEATKVAMPPAANLAQVARAARITKATK